MQSNTLNVIYSSDDNYAQHMGVSIYSLLDSNRDFEHINIFIVDNGIKDDNLEKLNHLENSFDNAELHFIPFEKWKKQLNLNMQWSISVSSYARLFISEMLPENIERIIYLDCDMIICKSLREMWVTDLGGAVLGAVQDSVSGSTKKAVGLNDDTSYFNAGMLLVDLIAWKNQHMGEKCLKFISDRNGSVTHHDQGVLNGVLNGSFCKLPLENNIMTIHYIFSREQILRYFGEEAPFYSEDEISSAKKNPTIIHYTPSFTSRPWVKGCKHPLKESLLEGSGKNSVEKC